MEEVSTVNVFIRHKAHNIVHARQLATLHSSELNVGVATFESS